MSQEILLFLNKHLNINLVEFVMLGGLAVTYILIPFVINLFKITKVEMIVKSFRLLISLSFAFVIFNSLVFEEEKLSMYQKVIGSGLVIFIAINTFNLVDILMRTKFGSVQIIDGNEISSTTYISRVFTLSFSLLVIIAVIIALLHIFGLRSWLEAGGVVGFIGVFLALTQGSWAPDVIGGLILLGTQTLKEGDVIEFYDGHTYSLSKVFKTKVFHTEILDLINNNRIFVPNHKLRAVEINNLSRLASPKGIRGKIDLLTTYAANFDLVRQTLEATFEEYKKTKPKNVNLDIDAEVSVRQCDAAGVHWSLFFYIKDPRFLLEIKNQLNSYLIKELQKNNIQSAACPLCASLTQGVTSPIDDKS